MSVQLRLLALLRAGSTLARGRVAALRRTIQRQRIRRAIGSRSVRDMPSRDTDVIVSLTSFPARVEDAVIAASSMLAQSRPPNLLCLVLCEDEFEGRPLPSSVIRLKRRPDVRILWVKEFHGPYGKYLPTASEYPDAIIVTVDDDIVYPEHWIEDLETALTECRSVAGYRGTEIQTPDGRSTPYASWPDATEHSPSDRIFLKGVGGVAYPPHAFEARAYQLATARRLCPTADDIWFKAMALTAGIGCRVVEPRGELIDIPRDPGVPFLMKQNVFQNANDVQWAAVCAEYGLEEILRQETEA